MQSDRNSPNNTNSKSSVPMDTSNGKRKASNEEKSDDSSKRARIDTQQQSDIAGIPIKIEPADDSNSASSSPSNSPVAQYLQSSSMGSQSQSSTGLSLFDVMSGSASNNSNSFSGNICLPAAGSKLINDYRVAVVDSGLLVHGKADLPRVLFTYMIEYWMPKDDRVLLCLFARIKTDRGAPATYHPENLDGIKTKTKPYPSGMVELAKHIKNSTASSTYSWNQWKRQQWDDLYLEYDAPPFPNTELFKQRLKAVTKPLAEMLSHADSWIKTVKGKTPKERVELLFEIDPDAKDKLREVEEKNGIKTVVTANNLNSGVPNSSNSNSNSNSHLQRQSLSPQVGLSSSSISDGLPGMAAPNHLPALPFPPQSSLSSATHSEYQSFSPMEDVDVDNESAELDRERAELEKALHQLEQEKMQRIANQRKQIENQRKRDEIRKLKEQLRQEEEKSRQINATLSSSTQQFSMFAPQNGGSHYPAQQQQQLQQQQRPQQQLQQQALPQIQMKSSWTGTHPTFYPFADSKRATEPNTHLLALTNSKR